MRVDGLRRFVGYALAPNERGHCGPRDHQRLVDWMRAGGSGDAAVVEALARAFEGPLPYLGVIAEANGIDNPFDPSVVEAYWVGNALLDAVDPHRCADALLDAFDGALTVDPARILATRDEAVPHHTFHVLVTYPWIDVIKAGHVDAIHLLDSCRIRIATVVSVDGAVRASFRPWVITDGRITEAAAQVEEVRPVPRGDVGPLTAGETVTLHWDHLVDTVTEAQAATTAGLVAQAVDTVNRLLL